ncbi:MAG: histidine phosphatase family protein [Idiomarina sp.]|nr:histidine phosphatase family protein [Idiomarina sp.]
MAIVTLVRHGQASFGAADYDQLSPLGVQQLEHLGSLLRAQDEQFDVVLRGSLRRHKQSAAAFVTGYQKPLTLLEQPHWNEFDHRAVMHALAHEEPQLRELFAADGKPEVSEQDVLALFMRAVQRWQSGACDADYIEPWPAFVARVEAAWHELHTLAEHKRILVITSGGPIAISTMGSLGMPAEQMMSINQHLVNSGISRFRWQPEQPRQLISLNEHGHVTGRYKHLLSYR